LAATSISIVVFVQFVAALKRITVEFDATAKPGRAVRLSVIMPARDEARDIGESLRSVLDQADVELEVIVVNDHSRDGTGSIADAIARSDPRVRVLHDPDLLPGWLGKCNAMQHAAALASGDMLLFTDADIIHGPRCFMTGLAFMERRELDFLSLFPRMKFVSLWENILLPTLIGGLALFATPGIEDPESSDALAAGAFLMVRSRVFRALGGFERIKHEMLDDVGLARLVKRNGYRVGFCIAPELLSVRLYKDNRHAFWGTTKNVLTGLNGRLWMAPAVMFVPVLVFWIPLYCGLTGAMEKNFGLVAAAAAIYALQLAMIWSSRRLFEFHPAKVLLFPLVAIPTFCCMMRALYLYCLRGAVEWRGRTVRVRGTPTP
jgi:hypothetical protein